MRKDNFNEISWSSIHNVLVNEIKLIVVQKVVQKVSFNQGIANYHKVKRNKLCAHFSIIILS